MRIRVRTYPCLLAAAVFLPLAACGGGSTSSSPTAAPEVAAAPAPPSSAPADTSAATIDGTVVNLAAAANSGVRALSTLRVSVVGTGLTASTDGSGRFTLTGVPAGSVQLRFEGTGIDATLQVDGLQPGQTTTITCQVEGSHASITGHDESGEVHGTVDSVGSDRLVVAGTVVRVDSATRILGEGDRPLALSDVKVGVRVEAEGKKQSDGSLLASRIHVDGSEDDSDDHGTGQHVELSGTVGSVGSGQLVVAGTTVLVDGRTRFSGSKGTTLTLADVKVGARVSVEGTRQANGAVLASRIELRS